MNKTEIQSRIDKCESEIASLKDDIAKCDCADGIEQEKCWQSVHDKDVFSVSPRTKAKAMVFRPDLRPAYMPECRAVTAEDAVNVQIAWQKSYMDENRFNTLAERLHKLGFRMKVQP